MELIIWKMLSLYQQRMLYSAYNKIAVRINKQTRDSMIRLGVLDSKATYPYYTLNEVGKHIAEWAIEKAYVDDMYYLFLRDEKEQSFAKSIRAVIATRDIRVRRDALLRGYELISKYWFDYYQLIMGKEYGE